MDSSTRGRPRMRSNLSVTHLRCEPIFAGPRGAQRGGALNCLDANRGSGIQGDKRGCWSGPEIY
eukprot:8401397-Prorocentrum_lima.AAC.1